MAKWGFLILFLHMFILNIQSEERDNLLYSPSKDISIRIENINGQLSYGVYHKKEPILLTSRLLWSVNGEMLGNNVATTHIKKGKTTKSIYSILGNQCTVRNEYRTFQVNVFEDHKDLYKMEFRVYNNGIAFRYMIKAQDTVCIDDHTTFKLPQQSQCWLQSNPYFYENDYNHYMAGSLPDKMVAGPPVTIRYTSGVYASITEGGLVNFSGMGLKVIAPDCFESKLEGITNLSGEIATPWRIIMIGDLNSLVNNNIVTDVSEAQSPVFKSDLAWIKPGNCVWSWLAGYDVSLENMKLFTDWAAELGIPYNLVDEGWSHWSDKEKKMDSWQMVADLVAYSRKKGVKILLWKAYPDRKGIEGIQTPERRRRFFQKCKELGIAGLKIDFFDKESQNITRYYEETLKEAAEFGLIINYHGCNKPTGLSRTYPNELTREAIKGLEYGYTDANQNVITPYTRFLAGHSDYTPLTFTPGMMGETTEAHQIAMTAIFLSPLRCYGGRPEDYLAHSARDLFLSIPTVWDETVLLPPSEIGECVFMARRKEKDWYIAALTNKSVDQVKIPLTFLKSGQYKISSVTDVIGKKVCKTSSGNCTNKDSLTIKMEQGGGFLARLCVVK